MGDKNLFHYSKTSHQQHPKLYIKLSLQLKKRGQPRLTHRPETSKQNSIFSVNNLIIPNLRGENMAIGEPSLSSSQSLSISSSGRLWVEVSDLLNHVFPIELKLESKNPLSQEIFSQFRTLGVKIWVQGGTFPLFLTTSLNFLLRVTVG